MTRTLVLIALSCSFSMLWDGLNQRSTSAEQPTTQVSGAVAAPALPWIDTRVKNDAVPDDPERTELYARLQTLRERLARTQERVERIGRDGWYGEQRNPVLRGMEEYGQAYQSAFVELRAAAKNGDPAARAQAVRAVSAHYPGSYLSLVAELALAEDALRANQPEQALSAIAEQEQAVAPEIAGNDAVRIQLDLMKGVALAQAGRTQSAREHLELAAASPASGPDADHYRSAATAALLHLEGASQATASSSR